MLVLTERGIGCGLMDVTVGQATQIQCMKSVVRPILASGPALLAVISGEVLRP
jgi:hypothetical protein